MLPLNIPCGFHAAENSEYSMNASNYARLTAHDIADAVANGVHERDRRAQQAAAEAAAEARRKEEAAPQRAAEILAGLPAAIAKLVAESTDTPQSIAVLWVEDHEYDGKVKQLVGPGFHGGWSGEPAQLKFAAETVWDALAHLQPELRYRNRGDADGLGRLGIFLRLR